MCPSHTALLLEMTLKILEPLNALLKHQFGLRHQHSTIQQCHRVIDKISSSTERKQHCYGVFLDKAQAFDRIWHQMLTTLQITWYTFKTLAWTHTANIQQKPQANLDLWSRHSGLHETLHLSPTSKPSVKNT